MIPNLNKWKFTKLHRKKRTINLGKGNKGKTLSVYLNGVILKSSGLLSINQLDAVKKYINKKLKGKDRTNRKNLKLIQSSQKSKKKKIVTVYKKKKKKKQLIIRQNFNLGLTKKPLQVRMGKGKGSPVDWVYPFAKNRIFLEYFKQEKTSKKLVSIIKNSEIKLPAFMKLKFLSSKKKKKFKRFNKLSKTIKLKCVKVL